MGPHRCDSNSSIYLQLGLLSPQLVSFKQLPSGGGGVREAEMETEPCWMKWDAGTWALRVLTRSYFWPRVSVCFSPIMSPSSLTLLRPQFCLTASIEPR